MTTKMIGLKDFRQNLATYTRQAQEKNVRFIIMRKNAPVLEVKKAANGNDILNKLAIEIVQARQQIRQGHFYTQEQMMKKFGLL